MSTKKRFFGLGRASAAGVTLGLLPATAALALGGSEVLIGTTGAAQPLCATSAAEPMTVPIDAPPDGVKGAPYSGVGTTEVVTTLADGNRITRTNTMKYYRDSAGRTRTEYQLAAIGPFVPEEAQSIVTISDPVSKQQYVMHPGLKRADVFKLGPSSGAAGSGPTSNAIFVGPAAASVNGAAPAPGVGFGGSVRVAARIKGAEPRTGTSSSFTVADEHGVVLHTEGAPPPGAPGTFNMLVVNNGRPMQVCKSGSTKAVAPTSIGEKRIEGLKVTGSRLEFTLEAGTVGNEQPITVRTDQWFSPDLGVVVSSMNHDPMIGDTTYRLEQIRREEPDAELFQVPPDYSKNQMPF